MKSLFQIIKTALIFFSLCYGPIAHADQAGVSNTSAAVDSAREQGSEDINSQISRVHKAEGLGDIKTEQVWGIINSLVIGYLTATIYTRCKSFAPDLALASAAGVTYIAGEFMATMEDKKLRDEIEVTLDEAQKSGDKDLNRKTLVAQRDAYIRIEQTANNKAALQKTSAAALAVAGALALKRGIGIYTNGSECSGELLTMAGATAVTEPLASAACTAAAGNAAKANQYMMLPMPSTEKATITQVDLASLQTCVGTNALPGCVAFEAQIAENAAICIPGTLVSNSISPENTFMAGVLDFIQFKLANDYQLSKLISPKERPLLMELFQRAVYGGGSMLLPQASAMDMSNMLGLGSAAIGVFLGLKVVTDIYIDQWIGSPFPRGILFEVLAASIYTAATYSSSVATDMNKNVKDIDQIIETFDSKNKNQVAVGNNNTPSAPGEVGVANQVAVETQTSFPSFNQPTPCFTVQDENGNCGSINIGKLDKETKEFLGASGGQFAGDVVNFANSVNGKKSLTGAALQKGADLAAKSAFAIKKLKSAKIKAGESLKKLGQDPKLLSKALRRFNKDLKGTLEKELKKQNITAGTLVASLGNTPIDRTTASKVADNSSSENKSGKGLKSLGKKSGALQKIPKSNDRISFGFDEEENSEGIDTESFTMKDVDPNADLGGLVGGVNEDRDKNIFRIVTKKYMETAYPIFFKEEKLDPFF
jgi:hypothetical protein